MRMTSAPPASPALRASQPAVPHDFDDDDAVVAVGGAVQAVYGFGGDADGRVKPKGHIRFGHVVIYGFGQGDDVHPLFHEAQGVVLGSVAPQADEGIEVVFAVVGQHDLGHIEPFVADGHFVGFVSAGSQNGAAHRQNAREGFAIEPDGAVFHQAPETIAEADDLHAIGVLGRFA
jgi:hypothetical protein